MIARSKPRFLTLPMIDAAIACTGTLLSFEALFFNQGRVGLRFLLSELRGHRHKPLRVAVQDFNCEVVAEAVIESGNRLVLLDIEPAFFSISPESLECLMPAPDVLVLTHYQGIPNPHSPEIEAYCSRNGVFLIEDAAQSEGGLVGGRSIGSFGAVTLESYAFDKPFCAYEGGALRFSPVFHDHVLLTSLRDAYDSLPMESKKKERADLLALEMLLQLTEIDRYDRSVSWGGWGNVFRWMPYPKFVRFMQQTSLPGDVGRRLLKLVAKMAKSPYAAVRLGEAKRRLVEAQRQKWSRESLAVGFWDQVVTELGLKPVAIPGVSVCWNRYSVLDHPDQRLRHWCHAHGIEAKNYNWPRPLRMCCPSGSYELGSADFTHTDFCCEHVLNLPTWFDLKDVKL